MDNEITNYKRNVFAQVFQLSNALQIYLDRQLALDELTSKQFFLMIVIASFNNEPPTLNEVSQVAGSSHQNVKQLAMKLQKNGFVEFNEDEQDRRILRLSLTKKAERYWKQRDEGDAKQLEDIFKDLSYEEITHMHTGMTKLFNNIKKSY